MVVLDVPFVKQEKNFCGPACLSMVLNYYGLRFSQDYIVNNYNFQNRIKENGKYTINNKGVFGIELHEFALENGFHSYLTQMNSINELKYYIDKEICPILLIKPNTLSFKNSLCHYITVVGYEDNKIIYHDPNTKPFFKRDEKLFDLFWNTIEEKMAIIIKKIK